ncbi:hypothetical protein [Serratia sp. (in: enterobacteria)]|uniref:hypothetical protein n=1 Tax=Serratia sp. (in: enterobacteria) TaxID=616 RepID=UPI0039890783
MVDYIGDPALARKLGGHPKTTEFSDLQMDEAMEYGHDMLSLHTNKKNWVSTDAAWNQAKIIEALFAASMVKSMWRDPDNKSQELFNRAKSLCGAINDNQSMASVPSAPGESQTSVARGYRTPALNPDALPYSSPRTDF